MEFPIKIYLNDFFVKIGMGLFKPLYFRKYNTILDYLKEDCNDVIKKYSTIEYVPNNPIPKKIWVLWWQTDCIVPLVPKACMRQLASIDGYETIILNEKNISEYIDISDVLHLFKEGKVKIQFLSDMIRMRLLRKYGGFWCDSTMAVLNKDFFDKIQRNLSFYSIKLAGFPEWNSVTKGYFSSYCWATCPDNPFFAFVDDMFTFFILKHERIIDYFQIDFTIMTGFYNIKFIRDMIEAIPASNPQIFGLSKVLDRKFDDKVWNNLLLDTDVFKLSWRRELQKGSDIYTFGDKLLDAIVSE